MSLSSPLGGGGPIASAFVEVTADTTEADRDVDRFVRSLGRVDDAAERTGEEIEDAFAEAVDAARQDLETLGGPGLFGDVERQAEAAGEDIAGSFEEAQRQADQELSAIGGPGTYQTAETGANQAAEDIENSFAEAQRQADAELGAIGGPGTFAGLQGQAEATGESITRAFGEAQRQADAQLSQIGGAPFVAVAAEAEVAAESVERSFRDSANDSVRALARIGVAGAGFSLLTTGLAGVAVGAGIAGGALVGFGLQSAAALEQTTIGFRSLLGSAEEADAFIRELQSFAATTPFEFQGLADNARRLLAISQAAGFTREQIIPLLTTIGDLTAVLGQGPEAIDGVVRALGQMASRGRVSTEEMLQLGEALPGFNVFEAMANGLGISTSALQDQLQAGSIPAREGIAALIEGMAEFPGAAGAMAAQSQTLIGVFSTFKDTVSLALTQAFQPLVPAVRDALSAAVPLIQTALGAIAPPLAELTQVLLQGLLRAVEVVGPALGVFLAGFADAVQLLAPVGGRILAAIADALVRLAPLFGRLAEALVPVLDVFATLVEQIGPPLIEFLAGQAELTVPLVEQLGRLATIVLEGLGPALADLVPKLLEVGAALGDSLLRILQELEPNLPEIVTSFGELAVALADLLVALTPIIPPLTDLVVLILRLATETDAGRLQILTDIIVLLTPIVRFFAQQLQGARDAIVKVTEAGQVLWNNVLRPLAEEILTRLIPAFQFLKDTALLAAQVFTGVVLPAVRAFIDLGLTPLRFAIDLVRTVIGSLIDIAHTAAGVLAGVFSNAGNIAAGAMGFLRGVLDTVRAVLSNLLGIGRSVSNFFAGALAGAAGIVRSAWNGLSSIFSGIADALNSIVGAARRAKDAISDVGDIASGLGGPLVGAIFQHGGIVTKDTPALLHAPEVVIPLNSPRRALQLAEQSGLLDQLAAAAPTPSAAGTFSTGTATNAGFNVENVTVIFQGAIDENTGRRVGEGVVTGIEETARRRRLGFAVKVA